MKLQVQYRCAYGHQLSRAVFGFANKKIRAGVSGFLVVGLLTGCAGSKNPPQDIRPVEGISAGHLQTGDASPEVQANSEERIPAPVRIAPTLPSPVLPVDEVTHTVVVFDVPVRELLFSLARDSGLELDMDPGIDSNVTMNALEQPLTNILERVSQQTALRYELEGNSLRVFTDTPFFRSYAVSSLNMSRRSTSSVEVSTQIQATGNSGDDSEGGGNNSGTNVSILSEYDFWATLTGNLGDLLSESGAVVEGEEGADNPNIIVNRESGVVLIRATNKEHEDISSFIASVLDSTQRQVMIEATIAEVKLSDSYQAGIDWQLINSQTTSGVEVVQDLTASTLAQPPTFRLNVTDLDFNGNELQATLSALETFGDVSVMSSPKIMAMNNQTALLKVVDNLIYFTVDVNIDNATAVTGQGRLVTFETDVNTVPVGFVMSVTPYIDGDDMVTLNVRPTISRVIDFVNDPNPALAAEDVISQIPVIQAREVESVLKVASGNIAVIGGLMQEEAKVTSTGVPFLGRLPWMGAAFRYDDNATEKTELVIFIRPRVIRRASVTEDLADFERFLPKTQVQ